MVLVVFVYGNELPCQRSVLSESCCYFIVLYLYIS